MTAVDRRARTRGATGRTDRTTTTGAAGWVRGRLGRHRDRGKQRASAAAEPGRRSNRIATRRDKDYDGDDDEGGGRPRRGGPPPGGKIREEGQGKEEGSASAEDVRRAAVQVDDGDAAFLLKAEATFATATASSSLHYNLRN
jgi:hypothetical protein